MQRRSYVNNSPIIHHVWISEIACISCTYIRKNPQDATTLLVDAQNSDGDTQIEVVAKRDIFAIYHDAASGEKVEIDIPYKSEQLLQEESPQHSINFLAH